MSLTALATLKIMGIVYLCIGAFLGVVIIGSALVFGHQVVFDEFEYKEPTTPKEKGLELIKIFFEILFFWLPKVIRELLPRKK